MIGRASGASLQARAVAVKREAPLPNLLVPIDLRDALPTPASLFALAESRRIARVAGATVYAIALAGRELPAQTIAQLGEAGADKVLLCEGAGLDAPALEATHGTALLAAVERVSPLLVVFPAGGSGLSLGPSLAARLGAAFAGPADLDVVDTDGPLADGVGRVFVRFWSGPSGCRRLDPVEVERPVIAILPAGGAARPLGEADIDHDVISCTTPAHPGVETLASEPDERAAIALARVLVVVDPALGSVALGTLRDAAPAGVVVADAREDAAAVAAATPEVLVLVGAGAGAPPITTPRTRTARVALGDSPLPAGRAADVLWQVPAQVAPEAMAAELAQALPALARPTAPGPR